MLLLKNKKHNRFWKLILILRKLEIISFLILGRY